MDRSHPILTHLGDKVRRLRKDRSWSRRDLARRTGISERFLADVESGRANPSVLRLVDLATALGTSLGGLISDRAVLDDSRRVIALLGLRGAGKSTVGPRLAATLGFPFVELDARVEAATSLSLAEIFQVHGESYYRRLEREVLEGLLSKDTGTVLATGGGLVTERATFDLLRRMAHTVWLRAAPEDHWNRVLAQGDTRPMADNAQAYADLCAILAERERRYGEAEVTVDTSARSADEVVVELSRRFQVLGAESAPRAG